MLFYFARLKARNNVWCLEERKYLVRRKRESCKKKRKTLYIYFLWHKWKACAFSFVELFYAVSLAEIEKRPARIQPLNYCTSLCCVPKWHLKNWQEDLPLHSPLHAGKQLCHAQRCWEILQLRSKDVNKALEPPYGILALKCQLLFRHCTLIISDRPLLNGLFSLLRE